MRRQCSLVVLLLVAAFFLPAVPASAQAAEPLVVGIWPQNYSQFNGIEAALGRPLHLFRGRELDGQFDSSLVPPELYQASADGHSVGMNIQPKTGRGEQRRGILYTDISAQLRAKSGPHYDTLVSFANEVLALPNYGEVTHYIQFHSEANLQAKPGQLDVHPYSGTGAQYRECYELIRELFDEVGATDRIEWQIVLTRAAYEGKHGGPTNWYPADTSLYDLVGVDAYHRPNSWLTPAEMFDSSRAFAATVGKPIWIDETASDEGGPSNSAGGKAAWFAALGDYLEAHAADVAGVVFSHAKDGGNWFLDSVLNGGRANPLHTGISWDGWVALAGRILPPPDPGPHDVSVTTAGDGTGSVASDDGAIDCGVQCTAQVAGGTTVVLQATPSPDSVFTGWSSSDVGCTGTGPCSFWVDGPVAVTASFAPLQTLDVTASGTGTGSVSSAPAGIDCGATCSAAFARGAGVSLTATPAPDSVFGGWSGACAGTGACAVTLDADATVDARFDPRMHTVTVGLEGSGGGEVTSAPAGIDCGAACGAAFRWGTGVTLTADPDPGSYFAGWSGGCVGTAPCTFTVGSDVAVGARFETGSAPLLVPEASVDVRYDGWRGVADPAASGQSYRISDVKNETVEWKTPKLTSFQWIARTGPNLGRASITVDGKNAKTVDLYASSPGQVVTSYSGLSNATHTVVVTVLGTKRNASTGRAVTHDAFRTGGTTVEDSSPDTRLDAWIGAKNGSATDGTYRRSTTKGSTAEVAFTGPRIEWITTLGRGYGKASVTIDGVSKGTVDLYRSSTAWAAPIVFTGLGAGPHVLVIEVLGTKNAAATGRAVVVDGFAIG